MLFKKIKEFFVKPKPLPPPEKWYELDGHTLGWLIEGRVVVGHMYKPKVGDGIIGHTNHGFSRAWRIVSVKRYLDPSNMWSAHVQFLGPG